MSEPLLTHIMNTMPRNYEAQGFLRDLVEFENQILRYGEPCYADNFANIMQAVYEINDDMKHMRDPDSIEREIEVIQAQLREILSKYIADDQCPGSK